MKKLSDTFKQTECRVYYPSNEIPLYPGASLFLGGTIDMGNSRNWQSIVINELDSFKIKIFNPRNEFWDTSLEQDISNQQFKNQVEWELAAQEKCSHIIYNFEKDSKSPITFLELGTFKDKNLIVVCPKGFYRYGNVDIFCRKYKIPMYESLELAMMQIKTIFNNYNTFK